jgi:3-hydroxyisobutyrate dehydrogenase-like beta-hydroxyacid dehydrogenase
VEAVVNVTLIGLGEVGRVAAEDLAGLGVTALTAWDIAFDDPGSPASRNAAELPVTVASGGAEAVAGADVVVCAVTAANDLAAATAAAAGLRPGTWFLDLNSSSPEQKRQAAAVVHDAGGRYVEAALMSAIHPRRLAAPFLLGGPHAQAFLTEAATGLGLVGASFYSVQVGAAAATKLCRSVVVKGLEALFTESLLAARAYGVEADVLASLSNILPEADWESVARYFVSRSLQHGQRRSEEMVEAAQTVAQAGVEPLMASAAAERQARAAGQAHALDAPDLVGMLDAIRNRPGTGMK